MANAYLNKSSNFETNFISGDQTPTDYFTAILNAPVSKLDADQYSAEDIDGVTESVFGSGNLNYLMMQGEQTNQAAALDHYFDGTLSNADATPFNLGLGNGSSLPAGMAPGSLTSLLDSFQGITTDRSSSGAAAPMIDNNSDGSFTNTTLGSIGASSLAANTGIDRALTTPGLSGGDGTSGNAGNNGAPGTSGTNGTNGTNGTSGVDGQDGTGNGSIINITNNFGDINFGDINLGDIIVNLGDIIVDITTIVDIDITTIIDTLLGDGITLDLDVLLSDLSELILDINDITLLDQVIDLNPVLDLVGDVIDLADIITGDLGVHIGLFGDGHLEPGDYDLLLGGSLDIAGLHLPLLDLDIPLDPLEAVLGDIDIDVGAAVTALTGNILGGLGNLGLGLDNGQSADTDLQLGLIDTGILPSSLDIVFDPVEDLVGDLDIVADLGLDLLGMQGSEIDNAAGDTDITVNLGIDILDNTLLGDGLDIPLDPIEALVGDIDLDIGAAADLLGQAADGLIDTALGGSGGDTLLSGVGDLAGNLAGNLVPGLSGDDPADPDLTLGGDLDILGHTMATETLDVVLDPVEVLLAGDIDLSATPNLNLLGDGDINNANGDTDLTIDLDIGVLGIELPPVVLDVPLDPVEAILGDIDFDIAGAVDLLNPGQIGDTVTGLVDGAGDAIGDLLAWPESILPDAGDILGGSAGGDGGLANILPDPLGSVVEGLGLLPFAQDNGGGSSGGGLFGGGFGGFGGGLF